MWAILCVQALWVFRPLRIPVAILSGLIILSTMTTGWHYFSDVLGGILLAAVAIATAKWIGRQPTSPKVGCIAQIDKSLPQS
jgi:membrane-associated phospholipid phosphatase